MLSSTVHSCLLLIAASTLLQNIVVVDGARILLVSPQIQSHVLMELAVGEELVVRGHEVYMAVGSQFPKQDAIKQLGIQLVEFQFPSRELFLTSDKADKMLTDAIFGDKKLARNFNKAVSVAIYRECELMLNDENFMKQLVDLKFDLAIVEPFVLSPCTLVVPHVLRIPFVSLTVHIPPWSIRLPALPSFFSPPSPFTDTINPVTFMDSVTSTVRHIMGAVFHSSLENTTFLLHFAPDVPSWGDLLRRSELFLVTTDQKFDSSMPTFPNVITVAGLTAKPPGPLYDDFKRAFNGAQNGVIFLSFGSMAYHMPQEIVYKFLETFSRLNQTVIARLPAPRKVDVPANVMLLSWLPQNDILGHPKTRLFITHCGGNGQHESVYHGVPMLGLPLYAEQAYNCHRAVQKGYGLQMNIHNFTVEQLYDNIRELLDNDIYRMTVKRISNAWKDEPMTGRQKAAFWIEHVIKYGGAHLRSPAMDQPLYRFLMLDVLAAGLLAIVVIVVIVFLAVRFAVRKCRSARNKLSLNVQISDTKKSQ